MTLTTTMPYGILLRGLKIKKKKEKKEIEIRKICGAGCGGAGWDSSVDAADATRS